MENIEVNTQSSIKMIGDKIIYFDPLNVNEVNDADIIFITHNHYDHFSIEDIKKIVKQTTIFIVPKEIEEFLKKTQVSLEHCIFVNPTMKFKLENIDIEVVPAYNINKPFHPKEKNWCGYIVTIGKIRYYIAGDTDDILENDTIHSDIAFLPIGGTFTMNVEEAANFAMKIKPKKVIPIHYGSIVGNKEDGKRLKELIQKENSEIEKRKRKKLCFCFGRKYRRHARFNYNFTYISFENFFFNRNYIIYYRWNMWCYRNYFKFNFRKILYDWLSKLYA